MLIFRVWWAMCAEALLKQGFGGHSCDFEASADEGKGEVWVSA